MRLSFIIHLHFKLLFVIVYKCIRQITIRWACCADQFGNIQLCGILNIFDRGRRECSVILIHRDRPIYRLINNVILRSCCLLYPVIIILHTRESDGAVSHRLSHISTGRVLGNLSARRIRVNGDGCTCQITASFVNLTNLEFAKLFLVGECKGHGFFEVFNIFSLTSH